MSAKKINALIEVGTSLGYSGEELKQFLTEERMRLDKERERQCSPTPLSRHDEVRCPSHVQQLRRPMLCSGRTTSVEHATTQLKTVW